jgi:GTPase SAR1 family protein
LAGTSMQIDEITDLKVLLMGAGKTGKTTLFHL